MVTLTVSSNFGTQYALPPWFYQTQSIAFLPNTLGFANHDAGHSQLAYDFFALDSQNKSISRFNPMGETEFLMRSSFLHLFLSLVAPTFPICEFFHPLINVVKCNFRSKWGPVLNLQTFSLAGHSFHCGFQNRHLENCETKLYNAIRHDFAALF